MTERLSEFESKERAVSADESREGLLVTGWIRLLTSSMIAAPTAASAATAMLGGSPLTLFDGLPAALLQDDRIGRSSPFSRISHIQAA